MAISKTLQGVVPPPRVRPQSIVPQKPDLDLNPLRDFSQPKGTGADQEEVEWNQEPTSRELFVSQGTTTPLMSKACVFVRNSTKPIDLSVQSDSTLLFCELASSALHSVEAIIGSGYRPFFHSSGEWGRADEEQKGDFTNEMEHFISNVVEVARRSCFATKTRFVQRCKNSLLSFRTRLLFLLSPPSCCHNGTTSFTGRVWWGI